MRTSNIVRSLLVSLYTWLRASNIVRSFLVSLRGFIFLFERFFQLSIYIIYIKIIEMLSLLSIGLLKK